MLAAIAQDFDFSGGLRLAVEIQRRRMVGGLIAAGDSVKDGIGREMDEFRAEMETELGDFLRDFGVKEPGADGVRLAGLDGRKGRAVHHRMRELLEQERFEGGFGAEIERTGLRHVRDHRCAGSAQGQDHMPAALGGEADFAAKESRGSCDDDLHGRFVYLPTPSLASGEEACGRLPCGHSPS